LYENQIQNEQNNISMQKVRLQDIEKAMSEKINQKIISIKEQKKKSINEQGKFEYNSSLDIYIDTENGRLINHNGKISYTFPMFRENENKLENIVFGVENNSIYGIEIFSYDLTDLELNHLKNGDYVDVSNKTVIELIESSRFSGDSFPCTLIVSEQASEGFVYTYGVFVRCGYPGASCPPGACDSGGGGGEGENQNDSNTGNNTTGYTPSGYIPTGGNPNGGVGNFPTGDSINIYHQPGGNQGTGNPNTTGGVYGNGGLDGTGITTTPVVPTAFTSKKIKQDFQAFLLTNNPDELNWFNQQGNSILANEIVNYLFENQRELIEGQTHNQFALQIIQQIILNPNLLFDVKTSFKSPANIDRSTITDATPEGARFNEVYNTLKEVPNFKNIFTNIFDGPQTRVNVKFEIHEHVYHNDNINSYEIGAITKTTSISNNYLIKINKQTLISNGTLFENKLENAKTIAHEAIHAFLYNLLKNPNSIGSIQNIDQKDLIELLNALQVVNANQHDVIFNNLTQTLTEILKSLKDVLTTPEQRALVEDLMINQSQNIPNNPLLWNWNTYFEYLSYTGLQGTTGFNTKFPPNSDALYNFNLYIAYGRAYLNL
jgi:hypothetical protein